MNQFLKYLNNIEKYICQILLVSFVIILFAQIVSREFFNYSFVWSEELSVYLFVWFSYFGACYATLLDAHNRVDFHFKFFPSSIQFLFKILSNGIWVLFNGYFIYLSYDFVFHKMNAFWKSQTLGIQMKYVYFILPLAFVIITIRVIQITFQKKDKASSQRSLDF